MRALVTGASAGLGKALTEHLLQRGWHVVAVDRAPPLREAGRPATIVADLGETDALERCVAAVITAGPFDLVVLNAGISATGRFEVIPLDVHLRLLSVNLQAPLVMTRRLLAAGAVRRGGRLVFVSSLSHFTGYPGAASYAAGKDALAVYAAGLRKALRQRDLTVTVAFPGPLATAHAARHAPPGASAARRMEPAEAAAAIVKAAIAGRPRVVPGARNRLVALAGRLAPRTTARLMRWFIFDKLDREVF